MAITEQEIQDQIRSVREARMVPAEHSAAIIAAMQDHFRNRGLDRKRSIEIGILARTFLGEQDDNSTNLGWLAKQVVLITTGEDFVTSNPNKIHHAIPPEAKNAILNATAAAVETALLQPRSEDAKQLFQPIGDESFMDMITSLSPALLLVEEQAQDHAIGDSQANLALIGSLQALYPPVQG